MKVLIACERSGIVRDAFAAKGHDAWSCDTEPTRRPGQHLRGDVFEILNLGWDLMIAHPPCTYLSRAGARWKDLPGRTSLRDEAMIFFLALYNAPIPKVCIENPEGYPRNAFRQPDQVINPFDFGNPARKKTLLWLRGLPPLFSTLRVQPLPPQSIGPTGKRRHFTDSLSSTHREKRSETFPEIASAMAEQWGSIG